MPHQITCASALPGKTEKRKSCIFPSNAVLVHCPNSTSCLISLTFFDSRLIPMLLYDFLSLVINAFSHRDCWGHGSGERKLRALQQLDCVADIQCTSELSSGFSISQGNAEALDRWGGKTKHRMIPYFLSNISAKSCLNRIVYVKIIASWRWDVFWDTV